MIEIRDFVPSDFDELWRLDQICFTPGISYSREELSHFIGRATAFTLVAHHDSRIAGFVIVSYSKGKRIGHIITIDVHPEYRRMQVGSRLMEQAESRLSSLGSQGVYLEVAVDNLSALAFYKRHGYDGHKTIPRYYLNSIDALSMLKRLGN